MDVKLRDGSSLRGFARGRAEHDLELQGLDGRMHFLTDKDYAQITPQKTSYMPRLQAAPEDRRNLIAYLSSLGGVQPGAISVRKMKRSYLEFLYPQRLRMIDRSPIVARSGIYPR